MEESRIKVSHNQGITVVELLDERVLDEVTINDITESLFLLVEDDAPIKMLLSFSKVKFLSSSMLGTLVRLNK